MKNSLENFLEILSAGVNLTENEAVEFFTALQTETENESLIAAALLALETKSVTENELFAMAKLMRSRVVRVHSKQETFVDIVGTGGSRAKIFNVSTASAFVIAGSGLAVAKHGNRAATSNCGSADVLSELGVNPAVESKMAEKCLNEIGICFMFAPKFHALSPVLGKVRRELGVPTVFNNLGPLCNPANAPHQIIGVWNKNLLEKTAEVLARLGTKKSWIVHGSDGLDEITLNGKTFIAEVAKKKVRFFEISPDDFEIQTTGKFEFFRCSADRSAQIISDILLVKSNDTEARNIVLINAAAAIYVSGQAKSLREARIIAEESLNGGKAFEKLRDLANYTRLNASE
ncbi:MAG TPA: anthranilate phosphoribosyltransferase [Pyrinomonadaceae bacterium]|nr:anthranilate phosphoribosyltransferase [Pyrinomonadaceae bacterium]